MRSLQFYDTSDLSILQKKDFKNIYKTTESIRIYGKESDGEIVEHIDFTKFENLKKIVISDYKLTTIGLMKIKNSKVKSLTLLNCGLISKDMDILLSMINGKSPPIVNTIKHLNLSKNNFINDLRFLSSFKKLKEVELRKCDIDKKGFEDICNCSSIEKIDLDFNNIIAFNEEKLKNLKNIKRLDLCYNLFNERELIKVVRSCPKIVELNIRGNKNFNEEGTIILAEEMIKHLKKLKILDITDTPFSDEAIKIITSNIKLKHIFTE